MKIDCHNHAEFSPDASQTILSLAENAVRKGFKYIAITEHMDLGFPFDKCPSGELLFDYLVTRDYFSAINEARARFPELEIVAGIEAGYTEGDEELTAKKLAEFPFEYIINSVHICRGLDCYWQGYFDGMSKKDAYLEYLDAVHNSLLAPYRYDAVGHIGYIARPAPYANKDLKYADFSDKIDEILSVIIRKEKILEINSSTGGLSGVSLPDESIIKRYYALGGRLVNFGSDSHDEGKLGRNYEKIRDMALDIGFKEWAILRNGKIVTVGID
ncbi:MAG: histidinol-phosphatase HisJ family protein [Clostridia bacterium]|nr:histidinol-phosphatase HisJ family protein [Clostridia bacterium]